MAQLVSSRPLPFLLVAVLSLPLTSLGDAVRSSTQKQWESYTVRVQDNLHSAARAPDHFLWIDQSPERRAAVQAGNILVAPMHNKGYVAVQSGLIHDWVGAVFLPGITGFQLAHLIQDYGNYSNIYSPAVTQSRLLTRSGDEFTYALTIVSKVWNIKAGLRGEFSSVFVSKSGGIGYGISHSVKLRELEHPDEPDQQDIAPEQDHGYLQRTLTLLRYREEKEGTFVEMESVTLSRDIPSAVRWVANPIIERISRDATAAILDKLRAKLQPLSAGNTTTNTGKNRLTTRLQVE